MNRSVPRTDRFHWDVYGAPMGYLRGCLYPEKIDFVIENEFGTVFGVSYKTTKPWKDKFFALEELFEGFVVLYETQKKILSWLPAMIYPHLFSLSVLLCVFAYDSFIVEHDEYVVHSCCFSFRYASMFVIRVWICGGM